jgi:hypothetical protein
VTRREFITLLGGAARFSNRHSTIAGQKSVPKSCTFSRMIEPLRECIGVGSPSWDHLSPWQFV